MINPQQVKVGEEVYEVFYSSIAKKNLVEYNYRASSGALFATVAKDLELARERRDKWLKEAM